MAVSSEQSAFKIKYMGASPLLSVLISQNFWPFLVPFVWLPSGACSDHVTDSQTQKKRRPQLLVSFADLIVSPELTIWFQCLRRRQRRCSFGKINKVIM